MVLHQNAKTLPSHAASLARTAVKPLVPETFTALIILLEAFDVPGHPVVAVVPTQFCAQFLVLLTNWAVPVLAAPRRNRNEAPPETPFGRSSLDDPVPLATPLAVMVEAQKVEALGCQRGHRSQRFEGDGSAEVES